jgi:hypothetical protein
MNWELGVLAALAMLGVGWFDSMRARERALEAARQATTAADCQLLDATVSLASLRPAREGGGMLRLRRVYRFEFSDDGERRLSGTVTLFGSEVERIEMPPHRERVPVWTVIPGGRDDFPRH